MQQNRFALYGCLIVILGAIPATARGAVLEQVSVSVLSSGGAGGSGASTTDMVFDVYGADGWGWAGGAGGVQGTAAVNNTGGASLAANLALKFNVGTKVDELNTTYGAGNWTIANPVLTFASSYSIQNNSRFGRGSGTFDIYWVGNDGWAQSKGTLNDKQLNPIYADNATDLLSWSGTQSLLGSEAFTMPQGGTGYVNLSYDLATTPQFVQDILATSAGGDNKAASLYLMGTSDTLGMIIFTGGQGQALPTLSFDVVSVPEPATWCLMAASALSLFVFRRGASRTR